MVMLCVTTDENRNSIAIRPVRHARGNSEGVEPGPFTLSVRFYGGLLEMLHDVCLNLARTELCR